MSKIGRTRNKGLAYIRRSTQKQEGGPYQQLEWAMKKAEEQKVLLDASPKDLDYLLDTGGILRKGIFWDSSTGADLNRPGFAACRQLAVRDAQYSHLFCYMRDRFARPEMVTQAMLLEQELLYAGLTIVFSDRVSEPRQRGLSYPAEDMAMYFSYWESAEYLYKLAARVIQCQRGLAAKGFWTGGRPPYGFVRVRVCDDGTVLEMADCTSIKRPGSHTEIRPKDSTKIGHWLMMLDWCERKRWGAKRIANEMNKLGIPSPDAGRYRTDKNGQRYRVSALWSPNTVLSLLRNSTIVALLRYGVQSEGHHRRLGSDGPRLLQETDRRGDGTPKVIKNDTSLVITQPLAGLEPQIDLAKFQRCQEILDSRRRSQRAIPRATDPARYPLGTRVFDMECTYPMYGRTSGDRRMYTCGLYLKCGADHCHHNQVDADALLKFVLGMLRQRVISTGGRAALRAKLLEMATSPAASLPIDPRQQQLTAMEARLVEARQHYELIGENLGRSRSDLEFRVLEPQLQRAHDEVQRLEKEIEPLRSSLQQISARASVEMEVDAAMAVFDQIEQLATAPDARAELHSLWQQLNLRVFLNFTDGVKGKKREVRVLTGGIITTGRAVLPIQPYTDKHTGGNAPDAGGIDTADSSSAAPGANETPSASHLSLGEGVSYTKVNRGDKI